MRKIVSVILALLLALSPMASYAQGFAVRDLPEPGQLIADSPAFVPVLLKGLVVDPRKPLNFDFIVDSGNDSPNEILIRQESERMVRYFLAALTVPTEQFWVNLSPYEKDRVIADDLGQTDLGRDMLGQDYILKQLTASFMYPEKGLGKEFWARVYREAAEKFGTTDIPVDTFNKVWIMPEAAQVFEKGPSAGSGQGNAVYVTGAKLKVMLDADYLAASKDTRHSTLDTRDMTDNCRQDGSLDPSSSVKCPVSSVPKSQELAKQIIREIILPAIETEVNTGKNFAPLRQIYHASILAKWYREAVTNTLIDKVYVGKNKISGVDLKDRSIKEQIYQRYIQAYKQGVFNYIKEEADPATGENIPRKYFSGGISDFAMKDLPLVRSRDAAAVSQIGRTFAVGFSMEPRNPGLRGSAVNNASAALLKNARYAPPDAAMLDIVTVGALVTGAALAYQLFFKRAQAGESLPTREELASVRALLEEQVPPGRTLDEVLDLMPDAYEVWKRGNRFRIEDRPTQVYQGVQGTDGVYYPTTLKPLAVENVLVVAEYPPAVDVDAAMGDSTTSIVLPETLAGPTQVVEADLPENFESARLVSDAAMTAKQKLALFGEIALGASLAAGGLLYKKGYFDDLLGRPVVSVEEQYRPQAYVYPQDWKVNAIRIVDITKSVIYRGTALAYRHLAEVRDPQNQRVGYEVAFELQNQTDQDIAIKAITIRGYDANRQMTGEANSPGPFSIPPEKGLLLRFGSRIDVRLDQVSIRLEFTDGKSVLTDFVGVSKLLEENLPPAKPAQPAPAQPGQKAALAISSLPSTDAAMNGKDEPSEQAKKIADDFKVTDTASLRALNDAVFRMGRGEFMEARRRFRVFAQHAARTVPEKGRENVENVIRALAEIVGIGGADLDKFVSETLKSAVVTQPVQPAPSPAGGYWADENQIAAISARFDRLSGAPPREMDEEISRMLEASQIRNLKAVEPYKIAFQAIVSGDLNKYREMRDALIRENFVSDDSLRGLIESLSVEPLTPLQKLYVLIGEMMKPDDMSPVLAADMVRKMTPTTATERSVQDTVNAVYGRFADIPDYIQGYRKSLAAALRLAFKEGKDFTAEVAGREVRITAGKVQTRQTYKDIFERKTHDVRLPIVDALRGIFGEEFIIDRGGFSSIDITSKSAHKGSAVGHIFEDNPEVDTLFYLGNEFGRDGGDIAVYEKKLEIEKQFPGKKVVVFSVDADPEARTADAKEGTIWIGAGPAATLKLLLNMLDALYQGQDELIVRGEGPDSEKTVTINLRTLSTKACIYFDVDDTLIPRDPKKTLSDYPETLAIFSQFIKRMYHMGIISANSRIKNVERILAPLMGVIRDPRVMTSFKLYANNSASLVQYDLTGRTEWKNIVGELPMQEIFDRIAPIMRAAAQNNFGWTDEEMESIKKRFHYEDGFGTLDEYPNVRFVFPNKDKPFEISVVSMELLNEAAKMRATLEVTLPFIMVRDNVEWTIKPLFSRIELNGDSAMAGTAGLGELTQVDPVFAGTLASADSEALRYFGNAFFGITEVAGVDAPLPERAADQAPGGIDIRDISVDRKNNSAPIAFDDQVLQKMTEGGFEGLTPVFINIRAVESPLNLLGISAT